MFYERCRATCTRVLNECDLESGKGLRESRAQDENVVTCGAHHPCGAWRQKGEQGKMSEAEAAGGRAQKPSTGSSP